MFGSKIGSGFRTAKNIITRKFRKLKNSVGSAFTRKNKNTISNAENPNGGLAVYEELVGGTFKNGNESIPLPILPKIGLPPVPPPRGPPQDPPPLPVPSRASKLKLPPTNKPPQRPPKRMYLPPPPTVVVTQETLTDAPQAPNIPTQINPQPNRYYQLQLPFNANENKENKEYMPTKFLNGIKYRPTNQPTPPPRPPKPRRDLRGGANEK
jgi:hypothetical protein